MKKILLLLSACTILCTFVACKGGSGSGSSGKIELVFWEMYGPSRDFDKITDEYNKANPGVNVRDVFFPSHAELLQRLQVSAASKSGEIPDIIFYDCIYPTVTNNLFPLVDLRQYFDKETTFKFENFYPVFQRFGTHEGKIISLHTWANCLVLYYNKQIFRDKGLNPDTPPKNWDEMYAAARKIQDNAAGIWGFVPNYTIDNSHEGFCWEWQSQTVSAGGQIWDENYTKPAFNAQAAVDALTFYTNAFSEGISTISPPEMAFNNGFAGMAISGAWMQNQYTQALGDNLGVTIWPGKNNPAPNVGGEHFMIVQSNEQKQQASWDFVKHWFQPQVHLRVAQLGGMVPTYRPIAEDPAYAAWLNSNPTMKVVQSSMEYAANRAVRPDYPTFTEIIFKHLEPVFYGTDAQAAVQAAYDEVVSRMGN
jgi:ABC-type glycerol-3-phosphate transport system substrate-binding protein